MKFTYQDALKHLGGTTTKCYLTGRIINILEDDYCLDHIVPVSKGGTNDLKNMGITIPIVNASKSNMTVEEYLNLCKEVLEYNGYKVEKL
jgi:CRISPR/Cas system Type II protein with McrA/HNH and RuvC-like nuclease domain